MSQNKYTVQQIKFEPTCVSRTCRSEHTEIDTAHEILRFSQIICCANMDAIATLQETDRFIRRSNREPAIFNFDKIIVKKNVNQSGNFRTIWFCIGSCTVDFDMKSKYLNVIINVFSLYSDFGQEKIKHVISQLIRKNGNSEMCFDYFFDSM